MTVCVSIKVDECIVFATDSAITVSNGPTIKNVYNGGDKLFNLHRECPIMAMFCGSASINGKSISQLSKELRVSLMKGSESIDVTHYTIHQIALRAHDFFLEIANKSNGPSLGELEYFVGGYGSDQSHGEVWKIIISAGTVGPPVLIQGSLSHGIAWAGQRTPIGRLLHGIDPGAEQSLVRKGVAQPGAGAVVQLIRDDQLTPLYSHLMPVTDAIKLADFLVDVTKGYYSFLEGSDIVGGPTDLAVVTKWEGFRWIRRKHFYPKDLNEVRHGHLC